MITEIKKRIKQRLLSRFLPKNFYFIQNGFCPCCEKEVTFTALDSWLRDSFVCSNCQCIPRERALMLTIDKYYPNWRELKIHETSPADRGTSLKLKSECKSYLVSQFYPGKPFGTMVDNFRNEDLENQTFPDESFDLVISQDVMEYVYNPSKAFKEIARTLKKGGAHIFTVPLINKHKKTEVWATLGENGKPNFLNKPEYHGNPVDPEGSPVTMHWGFDIVDFIRAESNLETTIEYINDLKYGVRAEYIEVLVSIKI